MKKSKNILRLVSFVISMIMLSSMFVIGISVNAADGSQVWGNSLDVISVEVTPLPETLRCNANFSFVVKTGLDATKIKVCYANDSIYTMSFLEDGEYVDSGNERIWTINMRVQFVRMSRTYKIYAGNEYYDFPCEASVIEGNGDDSDYVMVDSITLNDTSLSVKVGDTSTLEATISPENATYQNISWSSSDDDVATVENGVVTGISAGTATIFATADGKSATCSVTVVDPDTATEPPYPFWKDYITYTGGEIVYYMGRIYECNYWSKGEAMTPLACIGKEWTDLGEAEWTVEENPDNYTMLTDPDLTPDIGTPKQLTDAEVAEKWGEIKEEYSPEAALSRLEELLPESAYNELFPYRFGSENWKNLPTDYPGFSDNKYTGEFRESRPDYYSYQNLKDAIEWLANSMIKIENIEGADYCIRITCFNKETKQEIVLSQHSDWTKDWNLGKPRVTQINDYGKFLAEGSLTDRKRELAAFLANCSHETGGGWLEGKIDEMVTGLYWNEEINHIGATSSGYTDSAYPYNPDKSYHGRGPIQLSWNYNYSQFSGIVYGDTNILLDEPERVAEDGRLGFMAAMWFWMTPQPPKPSCHDVMIPGNWTPTEKDITQGRTDPGFGMTIMIINGGLEGNCTEEDGRVGRRIRYYRKYTEVMGVDITGEKLDTAGMLSFYAT